ncbi:MAG: hypothetical protein GW886_13925 [Rhodobacterales bacterium]|nr:hypothetical protein [Rhodobacterales bacterium]
MRGRASLLLLAALLLAGCADAPAPRATPAQPPSPAGAADTCGAGPYAALVGAEATALERVLIMRELRVIRPGMPVTADLRANRLNFEIDRADRIARIYCG